MLVARAVVCVVVACLCAIPLRAQEYNFRNFSVAEGLAQSQVYALCEDSRGYLWCGTRGGGVCRFDGTSFVALREEHGLLNNYVRCIVRDRKGVLWIGTDQGVSVYDGRSCTNYSKQNGLEDYIINDIAEDSSGTIWAATDQGTLLRFSNGTFRRVLSKKALAGRRAYALCAGSNGTLWIGTDEGLVVYNGRTVRTFNKGLTSLIVRDVVFDRRGTLWIATYGGGVNRFDGNQFTAYGTAQGLSNQTVLCALVDKRGELWFGTAGGGVNRFDGSRFTVFTEREGLCNNIVMALCQTSDNTLWFGSSGGGFSGYDSGRFVHFTERSGMVGNWVYSVLQDSNGHMWFGTSLGGVTRYDGRLYTRYSARDGFTAAKVRCIFRDRAGRLWFGTVSDGVFVYDGTVFRRIGEAEGVKARFVNAIDEDRFGRLWFASADVGVVCYTPGAKQPARVVGLRNGLRSERIFDIHCAADGTVWAATDGAGLAAISVRGDSLTGVRMYTTAQGLGSNTVRSIAAQGRYLVCGTGGGGLSVYNGKTFRSIRRKDGISSNNIYFVHSAGGVLWSGTERGIDRIELDSALGVRRVEHYGRTEGIPGVETAQNAVCTDSRGRLWFGTIRGVVCYDPREDHPNTTPPQTHISEVRLFFDPITGTSSGGEMLPWHPDLTRRELPHDSNQLSFDVVGISLRNPEAVRYRWKLDGFDPDWTPPTAQRMAVYSNIPPGYYTFRVYAINEDGVADASPATFSFLITPPFWATWWFVLLVVMSGVAALYTGYRARLRVVRRRSDDERRYLQMQRAVAELEQTSLQLSMNPHFIFNALTSIQSFIGDSGNAQARRYLAKFARLMRAILENSREDFVALEQEIVVIDNYLSIEQLTAPAGFDYSIDVEPPADPAAIVLPPMLVQPLVENAVHHGLAHRSERGRLSVHFRCEGALLCCTVTDNGVGRAKAAELQQKAGRTQGAALSVTRERLEIMSKQLGVRAELLIADLVDESGCAAGTKVELYVPTGDL